MRVDHRLQNRRGCTCSVVTVFESCLASFEVVAASRHISSTNDNARIDRVDARVFFAGYFQYMSTLFTKAVPYLDSQKRFARLELEGCRLYTFRDAADLG